MQCLVLFYVTVLRSATEAQAQHLSLYNTLEWVQRSIVPRVHGVSYLHHL